MYLCMFLTCFIRIDTFPPSSKLNSILRPSIVPRKEGPIFRVTGFSAPQSNEDLNYIAGTTTNVSKKIRQMRGDQS